MELRIFEFSPYGTAVSYPAGDFHRRPEEMLPVVSDVGDRGTAGNTHIYYNISCSRGYLYSYNFQLIQESNRKY